MRLRLAIILALVAIAVAARAATVTLDYTTATAKSDTKTLDTKGGVEKTGRQISLYVQSTTPEPQAFTLRVTGLKEPGCDIYINGDYVGAKSSQSLARGMQVTIPGTVGSPKALHCLKALKPKVHAECDRHDQLAERHGIRRGQPAAAGNGVRELRD